MGRRGPREKKGTLEPISENTNGHIKPLGENGTAGLIKGPAGKKYDKEILCNATGSKGN